MHEERLHHVIADLVEVGDGPDRKAFDFLRALRRKFADNVNIGVDWCGDNGVFVIVHFDLDGAGAVFDVVNDAYRLYVEGGDAADDAHFLAGLVVDENVGMIRVWLWDGENLLGR